MRQIGDSLRIDPRETPDLLKIQNAVLEKNEITQEEKDDVNYYGKISFKLMMTRNCNNACFNKSDSEYIKCFNLCNVKMYQIKRMYGNSFQEFSQKMKVYDQANANPFI